MEWVFEVQELRAGVKRWSGCGDEQGGGEGVSGGGAVAADRGDTRDLA